MDGILLQTGLSSPPADRGLARYDDAPTLPIDPAVFRENLSALRIHNPALAARIESTAPPAGWRAVSSLDGFPTFHIPANAMSGPAWHTGSAAPLARAAATLADYAWKGANPALCTPGSGAELTLLLKRLPPHAAVYVFVEDIAAFGAILRVLAVAADIRMQRCIPVSADDAAQFLRELLSAQPGLLAPGQIVRLPGTDAACIERTRGLCETLMRDVARQRAARAAAIAESVRVRPRARNTIQRFAVVDLAPNAVHRELREALSAGAAALGWSSAWYAADEPASVHVLAHYERLAEFDPDLTLFVNGARQRFDRELPGRACDWYVSLDDIPDRVLPGGTSVAAASPAIRAALQTAGVAEDQLLDFFWASQPGAVESCTLPYAPTVELLSELWDARAEAHGIDQPMHRRLWEQTRALIAQRWETPDGVSAARMLAAAESQVGATLRDANLRAMFLRAVERALIPAAVAERIYQTLSAAGVPVRTMSKGDLRWKIDAKQPQMNTAARRAPAATPAPCRASACAMIVPWMRDPLTPELLRAAACGQPLIVFAPDGARIPRALGGVVTAGAHASVFSTARELLVPVRAARANDDGIRRRAERAQAHVASRHLWSHRLRDLSVALGSSDVAPQP